MEFFDNGTLFKSAKDKASGETVQLERCIEECNERTIFIIDEAHRYRNLNKKVAVQQKKQQKTGDETVPNMVRVRVDKVAQQKGRVILLTATPYGTEKQNVDSLLRMLPPTNPSGRRANLFDSTDNHWSIFNVGKTARLPVVTVLGMLHVLQLARDRGDADSTGRLFLTMPDNSRRYLPKQIRFHRVSFSLPAFNLMEKAYSANIFEAQWVAFPRWSTSKPNDIENGLANPWVTSTLYAWLSSPEDFKRVLDVCYRTVDNDQIFVEDTSGLDFSELNDDFMADTSNPAQTSLIYKTPQLQRQKFVGPIQKQMLHMEDKKFTGLKTILEKHRAQNEKVVVFVKRHATALYLEKVLATQYGKVGCTVEHAKEGKNGKAYELKGANVRQDLIRRFAPSANTHSDEAVISPEDQLDILICTDADGVGLNMQDANVVVNYDLPRTADELFQRAGRVLRPTLFADREVDIYTFVPDTDQITSKLSTDIQSLVARLCDHQNQSNSIMECGKILPAEGEANPVVLSLATADDLEKVPDAFKSPEDVLQENAMGMSKHFSTLEQYKEQAASLKDINVLSVKNAAVSHPCICLFIRGRRGVEPFLYNLRSGQPEVVRANAPLDLVQALPDTPKGTASVQQVEEATVQAFNAWLEKQSDEDKNFTNERVCAIYLLPHPKAGTKPEQEVNKMLKQ